MSRPWLRRLAFAKKRALRSEYDITIEEFDDQDLFSYWRQCSIDRDRCVYCETNESCCLDHVVPLRRGGPHSVDNFVPACIGCNHRKGGLLLTQWLYITDRIAYPIPPTVLALTARTIRIKDQLIKEGRIVEYGNPPTQEGVDLFYGQRLGQKAIDPAVARRTGTV